MFIRCNKRIDVLRASLQEENSKGLHACRAAEMRMPTYREYYGLSDPSYTRSNMLARLSSELCSRSRLSVSLATHEKENMEHKGTQRGVKMS